MKPKEPIDIAKDLGIEIYGGKLNFREVKMADFMAWYEWAIAEIPFMDRLSSFDVESVMEFFEEWVKSHN